jgi:hypothetical protein
VCSVYGEGDIASLWFLKGSGYIPAFAANTGIRDEAERLTINGPAEAKRQWMMFREDSAPPEFASILVKRVAELDKTQKSRW